MAASSLPIITGIGHEIDTCIADLVADYHAHTPTEAASVAVRHWMRAAELVSAGSMRLGNAVRAVLSDAKQQLSGIERHEVFRRPTYRIESLKQFLDDRDRALDGAIANRLRSATVRIERLRTRLAGSHPRHRLALNGQRLTDAERRLWVGLSFMLQQRTIYLNAAEAQLRAISPMEVLRRGYSITTIKKSGAIVRSSTEIAGGEKLVTRLGSGEVESIAQDPRQGDLF